MFRRGTRYLLSKDKTVPHLCLTRHVEEDFLECSTVYNSEMILVLEKVRDISGYGVRYTLESVAQEDRCVNIRKCASRD